ncbi:MAG: winged helix-turn-helix transcriptional regulator [Lachnospiraceae bacterium]|nr:winged helix-turn-helix transcriptional regulator [Lachnospiraceae bacterium]
MDEKILKALGEPRRFRLLQLMSDRSYCVGALAMRSGLSESAVSQHLKILREAGLVLGIKRGYYTHYRCNTETLDTVIAELELLRSARRKPCDGPFYGCPESEYLKCKAYVPPEKRGKED